jgi:hypothetical protein
MISSFQTSTRDLEHQSIQTPKTIHLGNIASQYLKNTSDKIFGIWNDEKTDKYMICKYDVDFKDNDIVLNNKIYKGTDGLWKLLTDNQLTDKNL